MAEQQEEENNSQSSRHNNHNPDDVFTDAELSCIYEAFQHVDHHNTGAILCGQVPDVLSLLGIRVDPAWLMQFLVGIEAGPDTPVTFSELVDITAIVLGE